MFTPACLPILIGSLPLSNHHEALRQVFSCTPDIPLWPQLPKHPKERMLRQFLDGYPGLVDENGRTWIDSKRSTFVDEMTCFYEDALCFASPSVALPELSRFSLSPSAAQGFYLLRDALANMERLPITVKGQVTGPITCGIGIRDASGKAIFYDDTLRDMLTRHLALKARWQVEQLRPWCRDIPPLLFIDEPGMVSFGSTACSGVSRESACSAMAQVISTVKECGGLAGIHICANGDWSPALQSGADIISFDAFSYFDNFILYQEPLLDFLIRGGILAWGIVPTGDPTAIGAASVENLRTRWQQQVTRITALGFRREQLLAQTLITPSCGTGSLCPELATKVLQLTKNLAQRIRDDGGMS